MFRTAQLQRTARRALMALTLRYARRCDCQIDMNPLKGPLE
jgi:hypothetical protein